MLTSLGVSAMSCSRGVGMPPHRSSTALRSVMLPVLADPRKPGTSPTTCPPVPKPRSGVPASSFSRRGDAFEFAIVRRGGRRFFTGPPTIFFVSIPLSMPSFKGVPLVSDAERLIPRSVFGEPVALRKSPRAEVGASARPPRGDRRTPRALGRSPRWGELMFSLCSASLGDGIARLESPETPVTPEGTSRSGTVNAAPRNFFSLRGDKEGESAPSTRAFAPLLVLAISDSRRLEPGESVPSVSSASAAALSQKRGVTSAAPRAGADFFENAFSAFALDSARRLAPAAASFERSPERALSRGFVGRDAPTPRLPAFGAEWSREREERKRQKRRRTSVSRLRGESDRRVALSGSRFPTGSAGLERRHAGKSGRVPRVLRFGKRGVAPRRAPQHARGGAGRGVPGALARAGCRARRALARARVRTRVVARLAARLSSNARAAGRSTHQIQQRRGRAPLWPGTGGSWSCSCSKVTVWGALGSPSTCLRAGQFGDVHR
jgi:hypothetical protein